MNLSNTSANIWGDFMEEVIKLIQTLGFPIAVAIALFWQNTKMQDQHKEEMSKITEALNNNTLALTELKDKIGGKTNG